MIIINKICILNDPLVFQSNKNEITGMINIKVRINKAANTIFEK